MANAHLIVRLFYKSFDIYNLIDIVRVNKGSNWLTYRPHIANSLTIEAIFVNLMANSDHTFGC